MNSPRIDVEYQVWDGRSGNLVAYFDTADHAFAALNSWVAKVGDSVLADLYLEVCHHSPNLDDDESLELMDEDEWVGPGMSILHCLDVMRRAESSTGTWNARGQLD